MFDVDKSNRLVYGTEKWDEDVVRHLTGGNLPEQYLCRLSVRFVGGDVKGVEVFHKPINPVTQRCLDYG